MITRIFSAFTYKVFLLAPCLLLPAYPTLAALPATLANLPVTDRIKSCDPSIALPAAQEILNNPESLKEPITMFAPVQTLYLHGKKDEAVFWYYVAQLRTRYQLILEKGNRTQLLAVMSMTTGQLINNHALQDTARFTRTLDRVLEWDAKTGNPYRDKPQNETVKSEIAKLYDGMRDLKAKLTSDKERLETQARNASAQIEQAYTGTFKAQCQSGQLDPAFGEQETKKEWANAIQFAKSHPDIIRTVGRVKAASAVASIRHSDKEVMPNRYEVSVIGEEGRLLFALIDVSRTASQTNFSLACTTDVPLGKREVGKSACAARDTNASVPAPNQTGTYNFAGTSWRSPNAYTDTVEFRESGTVAFKTSRGYTYGQWKVDNGVLRFDNNDYSHFEGVIVGDWLLIKGSNAVTNWTSRWYRTDNEKIDKEIRKDLDTSTRELSDMIEARGLSILGESPETEKMLQAGKGEQYGGKHWLSLCDEPALRMKMMNTPMPSMKTQSELCYNWYGTRHDWKETILKEGCRGRCRP